MTRQPSSGTTVPTTSAFIAIATVSRDGRQLAEGEPFHAVWQAGSDVEAGEFGECVWHKPGVKAPQVRRPETIVIPVPEGDKRPEALIAFDGGMRSVLRQVPCTDEMCPKGFGKFNGISFKLQGRVYEDGTLPTSCMWDGWCGWHPLVSVSP